jgi:hypothetical protein
MEIGLTGFLGLALTATMEQIALDPKSGTELAQTLHPVGVVHYALETAPKYYNAAVL